MREGLLQHASFKGVRRMIRVQPLLRRRTSASSLPERTFTRLTVAAP